MVHLHITGMTATDTNDLRSEYIYYNDNSNSFIN